jgi:hypothetical protein
MEYVEHGTVRSGQVVLPEPLGLPEGTDVIVRIEPVLPADANPDEREPFESLPCLGMWSDREDMADSCAWVAQERDQWRRRLTED